MHKNLKRDQRLEVAKRWIRQYKGKKWIRSYRKHFGISSECAIQDLRLLQVPLTKEEIADGRKGASARSRNEKRKARRNKKLADRIETPWQDETYYYIADYTGWGFPYGITWEENERINNDFSLFATAPSEEPEEANSRFQWDFR